MKFTRIAALFLTVAVPCLVYGQRVKKPVAKPVTPAAQPRPPASRVPPPLTDLQHFYYRVAIYGYARTKTFGKPYDKEGYDNVDFYGENFDNDNYKRAMADEFERGRYRTRIRAKIEEEVRKVNFSQKFTSISYAKLGEYSFEKHSFPFGSQSGVNGNQFASSLPMSESAANAFVKRRASTAGTVNRAVKVRTIYSIVNDKAGFSLRNAVYTPYLNYFIHSVEVFSDEEMTHELGVIPRTDPPVPRDGEEWQLAKAASLTATKQIGKYRYIPSEKADGKIHNPLEKRPQPFGTITLTDVGIRLSGEQSNGNLLPESCRFFDAPNATIGRSNTKIELPFNRSGDSFSVDGFGCRLEFETQQERDRFFNDFTRTFQEWKTKYTGFQFAEGKLTINWPCKRNREAAPCANMTSSNEKPVWKTQTYSVIVESLEKQGDKYTATLVFENLTNKAIKIGWEEKSGLLPNAFGPYLIDENGKKYFMEGTDSAPIVTSSFVGLEQPAEIGPGAKLISRFVFSGSGDGKIFNLEAKGIEWPRGTPVTIEGLKVTVQNEQPQLPNSISKPPGSSEEFVIANTTVKAFEFKNVAPQSFKTAYQKWVNEEVAYIITSEERSAYLTTKTDEEREDFVEKFWHRRDPTPGTEKNEYREEYYERIAYANENFSVNIPGWKTDRGRIYITYGKSDEVLKSPSSEVWMYNRSLPALGNKVKFEFVDDSGKGDFRLR